MCRFPAVPVEQHTAGLMLGIEGTTGRRATDRFVKRVPQAALLPPLLWRKARDNSEGHNAGNSDDYRTIPLTEVIAHSSPTQALDPASFIVRARYELLGQLVECVLQGERFLALSGAPGTGKSVMARAIHDELLSRSVTVFPIERGESDNIGSRSIICQLLHKPEAEFQPDDVETLFDTLATGGDHGQRRAIIIDDAERLRPDALQYLRLVSNMVPEQMPPVVFVGRSSFWDLPGQPGSSDAHDLITCRMELERLSDEEAHAFISEKLPDAAPPAA